MGRLKFDDALLELDYLVFSSHKTATQTMVNTLRRNGYNCLHCHTLATIGFVPGDLQDFLNAFYQRNNKKLNIITAFREPIERHASSFFQWHGSGVINKRLVANIHETIIHKLSIEELQTQFIDEINGPHFVGIEESLDQICKELDIDLRNLEYCADMQYCLSEGDNYKLFIIRFDLLIRQFERVLSEITGRLITQHSANKSESKWYYNIYKKFIASLTVPDETITRIYLSKREIFDLLYPNEFDARLTKALETYGNSSLAQHPQGGDQQKPLRSEP